MLQKKLSAFYMLSYILSEAGYHVINTPLELESDTDHAFLSFGFDDSGERLWVAACGVPSTDLEAVINETRTIVHETLDIPVHVNAILVQPTDKPTHVKQVSYPKSQQNIAASAQDSYILIFKSFKEAEKYLNEYKNTTQENATHLPAAASYYETLVRHLNCVSMYSDVL